MAEKKHPALPWRRIGRRVRRLREHARLTIEEAARALDKDRGSLSRIENGEIRCDVHLARSMMDLYDLRDPGLIEAIREAYLPRRFRTYRAEDAGYVDAEIDAERVCEYAALVLPGLLQTEDYMRALFAESVISSSPRQRDEQVSVRRTRQTRLTSADGSLRLLVVVDEAALHREVGGPRVLRAQLRRLVELAALPTVTVRVLPFSNGAHRSVNGGFILLEFPEPDEPDMLYVEHIGGALQTEDEKRVVAARLAFDRLLDKALSPEASVALIEQAVDRDE